MLVAKVVINIIILLVILTPIALLYWSRWNDKKAIEIGRKKIEALGFEFLRSRASKSAYGIYFKAGNKSYYIKYYYSNTIFKERFSWVKETPEALVEASNV